MANAVAGVARTSRPPPTVHYPEQWYKRLARALVVGVAVAAVLIVGVFVSRKVRQRLLARAVYRAVDGACRVVSHCCVPLQCHVLGRHVIGGTLLF